MFLKLMKKWYDMVIEMMFHGAVSYDSGALSMILRFQLASDEHLFGGYSVV